MTGSLTSLLEGEAQGRFLRRDLGLMRLVTTNLDAGKIKVLIRAWTAVTRSVEGVSQLVRAQTNTRLGRVWSRETRQGMNVRSTFRHTV